MAARVTAGERRRRRIQCQVWLVRADFGSRAYPDRRRMWSHVAYARPMHEGTVMQRVSEWLDNDSNGDRLFKYEQRVSSPPPCDAARTVRSCTDETHVKYLAYDSELPNWPPWSVAPKEEAAAPWPRACDDAATRRWREKKREEA